MVARGHDRPARQNVLAVEAIQFDPGGLPHAPYTRRDSLVAMGDSTRIVSTFVVVPMFTGSDSGPPPGGTVSGSLLGAADRMRLGAARLMWREHLRRLSRHATS